jgi:UDP-3-O-[3-hydroxymyristoyl] glucosamine N-acyltransferase
VILMNDNLLIIGAGIYGLVAKEIAENMRCFDKIDFVDDHAEKAPDGTITVGTFGDLERLSKSYCLVVIAIGNSEARLRLLQKIKTETTLRIATLISPDAYVSSSAQIGEGCIIEPMAVVHAGCMLGKGCLISAGAVINHASVLGDGVHIDCNATVAGYVSVPNGIKVESGTVFKK